MPVDGARPSAVAESDSWPGADPLVSVVISTYDRAGFLPELLARVTALTEPPGGFELVMVDNGSHDDTWSLLEQAVATSSLRMRALRLSDNAGPAAARNAAVAAARGELIGCTDDDCLPEPGWLVALAREFLDDEQVVLVQGRTLPEEGNPVEAEPWSRSITVGSASALFETCNIAYRRSAFDAAGGFPVGDALTDRAGGGRAFGEDAVLGARLSSAGSRRFAGDAVVRHRWLPGTFRQSLHAARQLRGFPTLAREFPVIAEATTGPFLSRHTLTVDVGVVGLGLAVLTRRPAFALGAAPWLLRCWQEARWKPGRPRVIRAAQLAAIDVVGLTALLEGSVRARRALL